VPGLRCRGEADATTMPPPPLSRTAVASLRSSAPALILSSERDEATVAVLARGSRPGASR
jgi:hypothetical protein